MSGSRITQSFKSDKKLIWKSIYSSTKIRSGNSPAQIPRKLNCRWIIIQPLNVGDKGVAKIKWGRILGTEELGMSHKKINTCCDPTKPDHKGDPKRESKSSFSPEEPKSKILRGYCGGQLSLAFKLHWRRPGPISSLICTNGIRKGQAQYPVWG